MTTRKVIIMNEYLRLCKHIDNLLDKVNVLYNIDNYDFCDIIYMFNIYFLDCNDLNYQNKIEIKVKIIILKARNLI